VLQTLGRPTLTSQFNGGEWYYVSRNSSNLGFQNPKPRQQETLRVRFDAAGNVASVDKTGVELIASVDPMARRPRRWAASAASSRICSATSARWVLRAPALPAAAATSNSADCCCAVTAFGPRRDTPTRPVPFRHGPERVTDRRGNAPAAISVRNGFIGAQRTVKIT
jgi:hypothetical protein